MSDDRVAEYTPEGREKTKWDKLLNLFDRFKWWILVLFGVGLLAIHFGYLKFPDLTLVHYYWILAAFAGLSIGASAVINEIEDYLKDRRVQVSLAPVNSGVHDVVRIPRKTFSEFDIVGSRFPDRRLIDGSKILVARAIDFKERIIVPAQEFDDEKYPDDLDLIGENADGNQIQKYRNAMLQDATERRNITVDKEVVRETAEGEVINRFADALAELRNSDVEISELKDEEDFQQAAELALQAADSGGDEQ